MSGRLCVIPPATFRAELAASALGRSMEETARLVEWWRDLLGDEQYHLYVELHGPLAAPRAWSRPLRRRCPRGRARRVNTDGVLRLLRETSTGALAGDPYFKPVRRCDLAPSDEEAARGWRAMMLAKDLETCRALLRGESVPIDRLRPEWVARFGRRGR